MSKIGDRAQSRDQVTEMMSTGLFSKKREELLSQPTMPSNNYKINHIMTPMIEQLQKARDAKTSGSMGNLPVNQLSSSYAYSNNQNYVNGLMHYSQQEMPSAI